MNRIKFLGLIGLVAIMPFLMSGCFGDSISKSKKPAAPTNLKAEGTSYREITLTWQDNSNNETGFKIYWQPFENAWYEQISTVSENTTCCIHSDLEPLETYSYYVEAYNSIGSSRSNTAEGTTLSGVEILNYNLGEKYGDACITGQAWNATEEMMDFVVITAWFYHATGVLLDVVPDAAYDVCAQRTWNFEMWAVDVPFEEVARYNVEVTNVAID